MSQRMRAIIPLDANTRLAPDAVIRFEKGAPFKDSDGKRIGTITSTSASENGIEIEVEINEEDAARLFPQRDCFSIEEDD